MSALPDAFPLRRARRPRRPSSTSLVDTLVEENEERVLLSGTANLTRFGTDFPDTVQPVLEALEEQVVLMRLLGEATSDEQVTVRIGARERP